MFPIVECFRIVVEILPSLLEAFTDRGLLKCYEDCENVLALCGILLEYWLKDKIKSPLRLHTQLVTPIHWLVTQRMNMR